jgi:hypothetical protein
VSKAFNSSNLPREPQTTLNSTTVQSPSLSGYDRAKEQTWLSRKSHDAGLTTRRRPMQELLLQSRDTHRGLTFFLFSSGTETGGCTSVPPSFLIRNHRGGMYVHWNLNTVALLVFDCHELHAALPRWCHGYHVTLAVRIILCDRACNSGLRKANAWPTKFERIMF